MQHKKSHSHSPRSPPATHTEPEEPGTPARPPRRAADGHPRHHRREHRAAEPREGPAAHRLPDQLDDHELLARLREPPALRRPRRRPARTPPPVPDRPRRLHRVFARLGRSPEPPRALFAARAGQGLGAAMLSPAALSIITSCFHGHAKAKALAAWGAVGGAGAAIGVVAGGLLTEFADWRMIFFVNLPVAVALAITALKVIPADTEKPRWRGLDLRGARRRDNEPRRDRLRDHPGLRAQAGRPPRRSRSRSSASPGSRRSASSRPSTDKPLLNVARLADRAVGGGLFLMLAAAGSIFGLFFLCSVYLQNVLGTSPLHDRPRVHPARPRGRDRRSCRRAHRRPPRRARAARLGVRDRRGRDGAPRPRRRERHLPPQRPPRDARRRVRARHRSRLGLDRDPDRRPRRASRG